MTGLSKVAEARIEAERARDKVMASAQALQARLSPKVLARDTWEGAKMKGADLVEDAVDAVKARPYAATGVAAAIALFLAREPLIDLAGKLVDGVKKKPEARPARKRSAKKANTENKSNG
jgi:ElaB/YqjD/DUF883 family membrane-anchored ribosome-binding protein